MSSVSWVVSHFLQGSPRPTANCVAFDSFSGAWRDAPDRGAVAAHWGSDVSSWSAKPMRHALAIARRAYPRWHASFTQFAQHKPVNAHPRRPPSMSSSTLFRRGRCAGTVLALLRRQMRLRQSIYLSAARLRRSIAGRSLAGRSSCSRATSSGMGGAVRKRSPGGRQQPSPPETLGCPPVAVAFGASPPTLRQWVEGGDTRHETARLRTARRCVTLWVLGWG